MADGGPSGWALLLAARGIAVFMPNPRGSTGFGTAFAEANLGDMGGADHQDIVSGVDALIDRGLADAQRLGICGWSYGGFVTAWAITQTTRFKAAIVGAGICDWRSFHGTSNIPAWDALFYLADPYAHDGPYAAFSPIRYVDRVATPTLILHGEDDDCVPVGQAHHMFRALKERGVPVKLVVYPRAGHRVRDYAHVLDLLRRGTAWMPERLTSDGAGSGS